MSDQQQYGLLPCLMQGGVNHETTGKRPYRYILLFHVIAEHFDTDINNVQRLIKQCLAHQPSSPLNINSRASNPVLVLLLAQITPASVNI